MVALKKLFERLGFLDITTYVQSGNVVFNCPSGDDNVSLETRIEKEILAVFGYENVNSFIKTKTELEQVRDRSPYPPLEGDTKRCYFTFIRETPSAEQIEKLEPYRSETDRFTVTEKCIYLYCPEGYGKTKLSNNFFENKLKLRATTRNWNTVNKLIEIADNTEKAC